MQNNSNEIYILRNKNYEQQSTIKNLNQILESLKNENNELKMEIRSLEHELELYKHKVIQTTLPFTDSAPSKSHKAKRFVRVIFSKGSQKFFDYLLGDNRSIKIGDFVMVSFYDKKNKKSDVTAAQVIYISGNNEFSEHANSPIIGKADYPKWT